MSSPTSPGSLTCGWRKGEILPLTWENVDRSAAEVRIATSKNGHGRMLPLTGALKGLIERRWQAREYLDPREGHRDFSAGIPPTAACRSGISGKRGRPRAGQPKVPGRLFHDLRREAVRNMIRAGVPQTVAMSISGHRTIAMFNRYNIASQEDQREALLRTEAHLAGTSLGAEHRRNCRTPTRTRTKSASEAERG